MSEVRPGPACRELKDLEVPFQVGRPQTDFAKKFCARCPVRVRCLEMAMAAERRSPAARFGVFGGLTPVQRRVLQILKGPVACRCGRRFYAIRTNQLWCPRCVAKRRPLMIKRREAQTQRLDAMGLREHGTRAGYRQHRRREEEPCEPCRAANSAYSAEYEAGRRAVA